MAEGAEPAQAHRAAAELGSATRTAVAIPTASIAAVMHRVTKVFLEAYAVAANGDVVVDAGGYALALVARRVGVPVVLLCNQWNLAPCASADAFQVDAQAGPTQRLLPLLEARAIPGDVTCVEAEYDVLPASAALVSALVTDAQSMRPHQVGATTRELYGRA